MQLNIRRSSLLVICTVVPVLTLGCSTVFRLPPDSGEVEEVYLLRYSTWGHHSLAFHRDSELVEFTYGDWDLFALNKRDAWTAWKNMTFLTQGALGRKVVSWVPGAPICPLFKDCLRAGPFQTPAPNAKVLYEKLQTAYSKHQSTEVFNETEGVFFVKFDVPYWGLHNCNHEVADWLEELGGEVSGRVFLNPDFIGGMLKP